MTDAAAPNIRTGCNGPLSASSSDGKGRGPALPIGCSGHGSLSFGRAISGSARLAGCNGSTRQTDPGGSPHGERLTSRILMGKVPQGVE